MMAIIFRYYCWLKLSLKKNLRNKLPQTLYITIQYTLLLLNIYNYVSFTLSYGTLKNIILQRYIKMDAKIFKSWYLSPTLKKQIVWATGLTSCSHLYSYIWDSDEKVWRILFAWGSRKVFTKEPACRGRGRCFTS